MKRKILTDLIIGWLLFIGLIALIIIEQQLASPWNRITNGLWFAGTIAMGFFIIRGAYRLIKYEIGRRQ